MSQIPRDTTEREMGRGEEADAALSARLDALGTALATRERDAAGPTPVALLEEARDVRAARWSARAVGGGLVLAAGVVLAFVIGGRGERAGLEQIGSERDGGRVATGGSADRAESRGGLEGSRSLMALRREALATGEVPELPVQSADGVLRAQGRRDDVTAGSLMIVPRGGGGLVGEVLGEVSGARAGQEPR